jgi:hypothetical protein
MSVHQSAETHQNILARVPQVTGRDLNEWYGEIERGPSFTRFEEQASWLRDEYSLPPGYAGAIVREYDRQRVFRR